MRHINYNFSGTNLEIPDDLLHHDLLVVVDGVIKAPHNEWRCGGDYRIDTRCGVDHIIFETQLEGVCVQLIAVTGAILAHPTMKTRAKKTHVKQILRDVGFKYGQRPW